MDNVAAKLISLSILIVLTLTFSVLPYFLVLRTSGSLVRSRWRDKAIAILNCFAGGVFLGTLLLHLITEGSEEFEKYKAISHLKTDFPLFNLFIAGGFFLVALVELLMHSRIGHNRSAHTHRHSHLSEGALLQTQVTTYEGQYGSMGTQRRDMGTEAGFSVLSQKDGHVNRDFHKDNGVMQRQHAHCHESDYVLGDSAAGICANGAVPGGQEQHTQENTSVRDGQTEVDVRIPNIVTEIPSGLQAFLLLFALSFHTIFDGLAVGLQESASGVWQVFAAISIHKSIIAFCLGLEIFKCYSHNPWRAFAWMCFFSIMSPVGISVGIGLTSGGINEQIKLLVSGILQGVAAGTFLYVTFLEILSSYIGHNCHGNFMNVFSTMIGFVIMASVKLLDLE